MSLAAGVYLGALALLALAGARAGVGPGYRALVSLALAAAPLLAVDRPWLVLTGVAIAASCAARGRRVAGEDHEARLFAVALVAHMLLWTDGRIAAYALPLALLAAASVVRAAAERLAPDRAVFRWWDDRRTVVGARAVGLSTAAVTLALLPWLTAIAPLERLGIALAVGVICCLCEGASRQGSGVLSLLVGAAIGVELLVTRAEAGALAPALAWIAFAVGLALITRRLRLLTAGGAAGAAIVGVFLFTAEGLAGAIPLLAFFLLSSALSKLADRRRGAPQARGKGSTRDLAQVFANGGVAMALGLADVLLELPFAYPALVASLAAAAADTWATEIGGFSKRPPRRLLGGAPVAPGTSGGVTTLGLVGALAGALAVTACAAPFLEGGPRVLVIVALSGLLASVFDSLLGDTLQARFRDPATGAIVEESPSASAPAIAGLRWMDNDAVNLLATLFGAVVCLIACLLSQG